MIRKREKRRDRSEVPEDNNKNKNKKRERRRRTRVKLEFKKVKRGPQRRKEYRNALEERMWLPFLFPEVSLLSSFCYFLFQPCEYVKRYLDFHNIFGN